MKSITLHAVPRVLGKKSDIKNLRKSGLVPAVVYGAGMENVNICVEEKELANVTNTAATYIVVLNVEGKEYTTIFHKIQYHPVYDTPLHVDFLFVNEEKPITLQIPIKIVGNSEGVKQGGKFLQRLRKLRVVGMMANLPDELTIDISPLMIGSKVLASSLEFEGVKVLNASSEVVCMVNATRASAAAKAGK